MNTISYKFMYLITLLLVFFIITTSLSGLLIPATYSQETVNWNVQAIGQDIINLFLILPFLLASAFYTGRGNKKALFVWSGCLLYLIYTFVIYCFSLHFNRLFLIYCFTFGSAFYGLAYVFYILPKNPIIEWYKKSKIPFKTTGIYFITLGCLFYFLWLATIIPAVINGTTPREIIDIGALTNPVHVLDISIVLPGFLLTGVLLIKKKQIGLLLAPMFLVFCLLMDITIAVLNIIMFIKDISPNLIVTAIMGLFTLVTLIIIIHYFRAIKNET